MAVILASRVVPSLKYTVAYTGGLVDKGNSGGSAVEIDWNDSSIQEVTLTADDDLDFVDPIGPARLTLIIKQDTTGGWSPTWNGSAGGSVIFAGSGDPSAGASDVSIVSFRFDGTDYYGMITRKFE